MNVFPETTERAVSDVRPSSRDPVGDWLDVFIPLLRLPPQRSRDIRAELEDHLRARVDDLMIAGASEPEATQAAVSELGETADLAARFREANKPSTRSRMMQATLIAAAGAAVTFGAVSITNESQRPAGVIHSATAALPAPSESLQSYDVSSLVRADGPLHETHEGEVLVDTVISLANADTWEENGGTSSILLSGNTLFIDTDEKTHADVAWVLDSLRADADRAAVHEQKAAEQERHEREARLLRVRDACQTLRDQLQAATHRLALAEGEISIAQNRFAEQPEEVAMRTADLRARIMQMELDQDDVLARYSRLREHLIDLELSDLLGFDDDHASPSPSRAPAAAR